MAHGVRSRNGGVVRSHGKRLFGVSVAVSIAALALGTGVVEAGARTAAAPAAHPASLPAGYDEVTSPAHAVPAGTRTHFQVPCPAGTKPVGGGVVSEPNNLAVNVSASYPTGASTWAADVTNASGADTQMAVHAVCVNRPASKFSVQTGDFTVPANSTASGAVTCASGVVVGGGALTSSSSTAVNIATLYPSSNTTWTARINNATAAETAFTVYAICRTKKVAGYSLQHGATVLSPPGQQTFSSVACPGASVPLSGGMSASGTGLGQNLNTSTAFGQQWGNYVNNADATANHVRPWAVCAGT
jgi:hypothetical protein